MKLRLGYIVILALVLSGCLVCRHVALAHYGWAVENGYAPKFVLYTTTSETRIMSGGIWKAHVNIITEKGKWVYGSPPSLHDEPEYELGKYCWVMNMDQYLEWLEAYDRLSQQPYIERKEWPLCKNNENKSSPYLIPKGDGQ